MDENEARREKRNLRPAKPRAAARRLPHHYILTPIGKPQNATNTTTSQEQEDKAQDAMDSKPLVVMPPGPVIVDEHNQTDGEQDSVGGDGNDEEPVVDEEDEGGKNTEDSIGDNLDDFDDHDSGEDKVAAMIEAMQAKAADGSFPLDESEEVPTDAPAGDDVTGEGDGEYEQETFEKDDDAGDAPAETAPTTIDEGDEDGKNANDEDSAGDDAQQTNEDSTPTDEAEPADEEPVEGDTEAETGGEKETGASETTEAADEESSISTSIAPSAASSEQDMVATPSPTASASSVETASPTAPTLSLITASPTAAPSAIATEAQPMPSIVIQPEDIPNTSPTAPADSPIAPPHDMNKDHEDAPPPKSHEQEPHSSATGTTDASGESFGSMCRHPSGLVQQVNCKFVLGAQSHPIGVSVAFLVAFIWGCCLCRRVCYKGRDRRDDRRGEYREVANQYDDVLFQDTFDDNYSASFADDRSADGSISDEEDDWTKGPNIEMSPHREDDLTLEEMNG